MAVMCQGCSIELQTWTGKCPNCGGTHTVELRKRQDPMIDKVIGGRFRISKKLGQGGMGSVYLAEHVGVGQKVAIKFLNPNFSGDPDIVRRFLNEAKSYGQVSHPNAVHLHDFGQDDEGALFISMEFIEGNDLKKQLEKDGRLRLKDAVDIVLQVCDVLGYAHEKGIVHRDLKPENIMLQKGMRGFHAKVLDFGVARLMEEQGTRLTAAGTITGTPRYMSPEQAEGRDVDRRTDIYALGIVLFEVATGRHPYPGTTITEILRSQVLEPMPHLDDVAPELRLPPTLDAVIQKATAKNRDERYQSMAELAEALSQAIPTEAFEAFDPGRQIESAQTIVKAPVEKTSHQSSPYDRDRKVQGGKGGLVAGVIAVLVLVGGGGAWALLGRGGEGGAAGTNATTTTSTSTTEAPTPTPNVPTPNPNPTPPNPETGSPSTGVATAELRRVADSSQLGTARSHFVAGDLETCAATLDLIPADTQLADEVAELRQSIDELNQLMARANSHYGKGQCTQAVKLYREVLKKNKGMGAAKAGIARCEKQMIAPTIE